LSRISSEGYVCFPLRWKEIGAMLMIVIAAHFVFSYFSFTSMLVDIFILSSRVDYSDAQIPLMYDCLALAKEIEKAEALFLFCPNDG
jgi:hypothetical protein